MPSDHHHPPATTEQAEHRVIIEIMHSEEQVFPMKLYRLLQNTDFEEMIHWNPHGLTFQIFQPKRFLAEVLSTVFDLKKWTSFQRQLNIYGFRRIRRGSVMDGYYHPYFQRDRIDLIRKIARIPVKGKGKRKGKGKSKKSNHNKEKKNQTLPLLPAADVVNDHHQPSPSVRIVPMDDDDDVKEEREEGKEEKQAESQSRLSPVMLTISPPSCNVESVSDDSTVHNHSSSSNLITKYASMVKYPWLLPPPPVYYGSFFPVFADPSMFIPRHSDGTINESDRSQTATTALSFHETELKIHLLPSSFTEEEEEDVFINSLLMQLQEEE